MDSRHKVIIIGSSHAGAIVGFNLVKDGFNGDISILTQEKHPPYHRPPLSKDFFKGNLPQENLYFKQPSFYEENNILLQTQTIVDSINRKEKSFESLV
jgi:3-phenylpropionate/trans-cinnamate dioxygenase ferredoxin reductase subunit